ncbi:hypothetical protein pah_c048o073 [Parachlamydia acanthamoebae str. Hall's coccus]|uniref:Uncharacterized protein n=1 Tax=Parachlamydia acanthamoebae TaxID=83552 RepID=A0A0C1C5F2_9BACT|nr:hypothetical protein pah_c048o073 [Parachlamydia acanthamoebae str. Hall's coccus]KIA76440.1 hypothetical protein DB43_AG00180 [Parachlamydia acanthamoebae]
MSESCLNLKAFFLVPNKSLPEDDCKRKDDLLLEKSKYSVFYK